MDVIFAAESFRDMILFSGRFANNSMPESDWKEVYGFLVGKVIATGNSKFLHIQKLIPMIHGTRTEVYFSEGDYAISEKLMGEIHRMNLFVCGWYHTHPGLDLFLSDTDIYNQLGFQSVFPEAVAVVFDFTKISEKNNGLKIFRLENADLGISSSFIEVSYRIESRKDSDRFFMARSLVDISGDYKSDSLLIKEANEILSESGSFEGFLQKDNTDVKSPVNQEFKIDSGENYSYDNISNIPEENNEYILQFKNSEKSPQDEGEYYEILDQYSEEDWEIRSLHENIEKMKEQGKPTGLLLIKLANRLVQIMKFNEALGYLEAAEAEFQSNDNDDSSKIGLAISNNELGLFHEERGDFNTALNYLESSVEILEKMDDNIKITQIYNNIGNIYLKTEDYDRAFSFYKKAFIISKEHSYQLGMVASLNNAVDVLLFLKNYKLAYDILANNYMFFKATNNNFGIGITFSKLGHLYFTQGEGYYNLSEKYFGMALVVKIQNQYPKDTLEDWIFLSKIYSSRVDMNKAENLLLEGLNIVRTYELGKDEGKFYKLLAECYSVSDRIDEMMEYYKLALENYKDFGDDEGIGEINNKLADLYLTHFNNHQEALNHLYKSLEIYRNQHYSKMIGETLLKISDIHLDLKDESSAMECLREAKNIFTNLYDEFNVKIISEKIRSMENNVV